jgi:cbb3-type cytochrome oxidase subunit 3
MKNKEENKLLVNLPACAADFIALVIKKMRYHKKVRAEVMVELAAHFEDELRDCKTDKQKQQRAGKLIEEFGDPELLGILLHRAKKRCRPLWRTIVARTFQTVGILFLCLILYAVYISAGRPNIRTNYAQEAVRFTRPTADESLNAANLYQKAIDSFIKKYPDIEKRNALQEVLRRGWVKDLNDVELKLVKQCIVDNKPAIELFIEGTGKPYCWWDRTDPNNPPLLAMLMPEFQPIREIARMIIWQAKLKAYAGDVDGAFDDLFTCFRAGNHFKGPRTLIDQLVGTAIQTMTINAVRTILSNTNSDSAILERFQQKFQKLEDETVYTPDFETEKFCVLDVIQRCYTDNGRGSGHMIPGRLKEFNEQFGQGVLDSNEPILHYIPYLGMALISLNREQMTQAVEKLYGDAQKNAYKTPWQLHSESYIDFDEVMVKWSSVKRSRYFPILELMPAFKTANVVFARSRADADALITTIAVLRHKKEKGVYPENLQQLLEAGYIKELPPDPFSYKPLVYKKTDDGFTLYSIGKNFIDDGGQVARDEKGKVERWADKGDEVFWPVNK